MASAVMTEPFRAGWVFASDFVVGTLEAVEQLNVSSEDRPI